MVLFKGVTRLGHKCLLLLVPCLLLATSVYLLGAAALRQAQLRDQVRQDLAVQAAALASLLSPALLTTDGRALTPLLRAAAAEVQGYCLILGDAQGRALQRIGLCPYSSSEPVLEVQRRLPALSLNGYTVSNLRLSARLPGLGELLARRALELLPLLLLLTGAAGAAVMLASRRWVTQPLERLRHSLRQAQDYSLHLPVDWPSSADEVGRLLAQYNVLQALRARRAGNLREQMFREIFSKHASVMYLVDPDSLRLVDANRAAEAFYGLSRRELLERSFQDLHHLPEERMRAMIADFSRIREARFDLRHRNGAGQVHELEVYVSPIVNEDGEGVLFVTVHDGTERKRAENTLRERTRLLAMAEHLAHLGYWYFRQEDGVLDWSEETYRIYGLQPGSVQPSLEFSIQALHPDDRGLAARALRSAISDHQEFGIELRLLRPDGSLRHVWSQGCCDYGEDGRCRGVLGVFLDITERKQLEQDLLERETIWRQGAALAKLGAFVWDMTEDRCLFCSEELAQLHEMTVAEYLEQLGSGNKILTRIHPEDRQRFTEVMEYSATGRPYSLEFRIITASGAIRHVAEAGEPIDYGNGHVVLVGSVQDITARKRMEEELRQRALYDSLTGACNRRYFLEQSAQELKRAQRYRRPLSLLMLDIDHFKRINDSHGHAVGDEALRRFSAICRETLRVQDVFGRLGGEEFAILLPETNGVQAVELAERLRQTLARQEHPMPDGTLLRFTVSIGATLLTTEDRGVDMLLSRADCALYRAKQGGRNRVVFGEGGGTQRPLTASAAGETVH
ncbi:MAG TPA: diguanylate cyclase [Candidatus Competibacteraceae bacterium]|nr:diguanylate cyclase [Candidatus Competibacteraceae bacterium]